MTLSRWLRDYLYIPLGGNRHGYNRTLVNLMLTMLLGGLWHGAAWTFVIWGAIHGGWLVLERVASKRWHEYRHGEPLLDPRVSQVLRWALTFHVVCLAWIFFRAPTFSIAIEYLGALFGPLGAISFNPVLIGLLIGAVAVQFMSREWSLRLQRAWSEVPPVYMGVAFALILTVIDTLGPEGVAPFIYFQF
jgi:D-alanyl-lipoteichoic acid acyltransferase DltB (MBOAT superfamily)